MSDGGARPCPVCGSRQTNVFLELRDLPLNANELWVSASAARNAARGDVRLAACRHCGMIWNVVFDAASLAYTPSYENSLHFSPTFQRYAEELASRLIDRYDIRGKTVVEIGSGKGEFLSLLCTLGDNRGIGFDPSYGGESSDASNGRIRFVPSLYDEATAERTGHVLVFRHVLEHIPDPLSFLRMIRRTTATGAVVYCEVPAAERLLHDCAIWDVIYTHCSVFDETALRTLFRRAGFEVLDTGFAFDDQYLWIEAAPAGEVADDVDVHERSPRESLTEAFAAQAEEKRRWWSEKLRDRDRDVAVWGAGAKATTFLNVVRQVDSVRAVIDINPRKSGKYVAGTGHRIVAPATLADDPPAEVIVMNAVYRAEIEHSLAEVGLAPALATA